MLPRAWHAETNQVDGRLKGNGVFFLPWIGRDYENGFKGQKLLILGESHYDTWCGEKHKLRRNFTRGCVAGICARDHDSRAALWLNLEQALLNQARLGGWAQGGGAEFWPRLAFYNFLQTPVTGGADAKPQPKQFTDSRPPFRAVIEELRPERILVCGYKRLWEQMESTPYELNKENGETKELYLHNRLQAYLLKDSRPVWCLAIQHPSRAFSWRAWHPVIEKFVREPRSAISDLQRLC
ncbi:MAG TPA: hypothetical protein VGL83_12635 [Stellaceae bacterium]|jgi:hypothetical protein